MRPRLLILALVLAAGAPSAGIAASPEAASEARVVRLAAQLRCPVCQNLSVKDSPSKVSLAFRRRIRDLVEEGRSDEQIRAFFVARYGDWILLEPPKRGIALAVWLAPGLLLAAGLALVGLTVRRWALRGRQLQIAARAQPDALDRARSRLAIIERDGHGR